VLVNKKTATLVKDTHVYRGADIYSDHFLVVSKLVTPKRWRKNYVQKQRKEEKYNVHLLKEESILNLHKERLNRYLDQRPISNNIDFNGIN
jgi:hypothetical protein